MVLLSVKTAHCIRPLLSLSLLLPLYEGGRAAAASSAAQNTACARLQRPDCVPSSHQRQRISVPTTAEATTERIK